MNSVFQYLLDVKSEKGAGYIVLIDPDKKNEKFLIKQVEAANHSGVDALFVGGSLMMDSITMNVSHRLKSTLKFRSSFFPGA